MISGSSENHVAAGSQVQLPAREFPGQSGQVFRTGDVDGHIVREQVHVPHICHGNGGDFPPQQLRNGPLAPGELVDGQVDLQAHVVNGPDDFLVPGREGIKGSGEEGHRPGLRKGELRTPHLAGDDEAVQVVQHGGVVVEGEGVPGRLVQEAQELFPGTNQAVPPHLLGNGGVAEDAPAQHSEGGLVDGWVVMGNAGEEKPQHPAKDSGPLAALRLGHHGTQGMQGGAGGPNGASVNQVVQVVYPFNELLIRHLADQAAQEGRDVIGDLLLTCFQLPGQVHHDFVALVHCEVGRQAQKGGAGVFPHRQVLTDGQEIGKVHGGVEGLTGVGLSQAP